MSEATTGVAQANARVSTIPKLSPPSDGAAIALAPSSSSVSRSWGRKPRISIPSDGVRSFAIKSLTASGSAPMTRRVAPVKRRGSPARRGAGSTGLCVPPAAPRGSVLATGRVGLWRDQHAVRDHFVVGGRVPVRGGPRLLRHRDTGIDPVEQEPPDRYRHPRPAELARGVERRDDGALRHRERCDTECRRQRFVEVEQVELLPLERLLDPPDRAGARG